MNLSFFSDFYEKSPATFFLSAVVLLMTILGQQNKKAFFAFILHPVSVVHDRQIYRLFTADLVNADWLHLILNEFMLYVFCSDLEENLRTRSVHGTADFIMIYALSLCTSAGIITWRHRHDSNYSTTGTSGSIMGCMFSFMLLAPNYIVYHLPHNIPVKNVFAGLLYIVLLIIVGRRSKNSSINHEIHFWGAIGGLAGTIVLFPEILQGIRL